MIGLATSIPQKYESSAIYNILNLRVNLGWTHQIEVWEAGEEISEQGRDTLTNIPGVQLRNTLEYDDRVSMWRGYQIKAPALLYSAARHCVWCDGDSRLYQNPTALLESEEYEKTGSYMFRDFDIWKFKDFQENAFHKFNNIEHYFKRQQFIRQLFPSKPVHFPPEWDHLYTNGLPEEPVAEAHAETAVFAIDRERNADVVRSFYNLNYHHSWTYSVVHGDKELLWMAFLLHGKPYSIHPTYPEWRGHKPLQSFGGKEFYM
jgi:hypothetical protein